MKEDISLISSNIVMINEMLPNDEENISIMNSYINDINLSLIHI